ncbi:MAG: hypothetical protein FJW30_28460 [Acidobacteria bacterium]|nr:hypothetical protein [Acidobacteriota bacterium]
MAALDKLLYFALVVSPAFAQAMDGPFSVLLFHAASRSVRPVIGMPGSAYLGQPFRSGVDFASIAPGQSRFVSISGNELDVVERVHGQEPRARRISGVAPGVRTALWSEDSTKTVLYSETANSAQWLGGFEIGAPISLPDGSKMLALSSDGETALFSSSGKLYRLARQGAPEQIAVLDSPSAATFCGTFIIAADEKTREIVLIADTGSRKTLVSGLDGISALITKAGRLYAVRRTDRELRVFRLSDGSLESTLALGWEPTALVPITGQEFLLTPEAATGDPLAVLSTRDEPVEHFIPAGRAQ